MGERRRSGSAVRLRTTVMAVAVGLVAVGVNSRAGDEGPGRAEIRVGIELGDIRGSDQRALQSAVELAASLGGGTVYIGPGRYTMRNALRLRDHVRILGQPGKTVLVACDGVESPLACDGDCNERQILSSRPMASRSAMACRSRM